MNLFIEYGIMAADDGTVFPGWQHAKKITIPAGQIDTPLVNFPCPVYLNSSNFDFSQCKPEGSDIRFTDADLNPLKFERVEHNYKLNGYKQGIEDIAVLGGWKANYVNSGTATKEAEKLSVSANGAYRSAGFMAVNAINFANYKSVKVKVTDYANSGTGACDLRITTNSNGADGLISSMTLDGVGEFTLNTSGISGTYYMSVLAQSGSSGSIAVKFDLVELEYQNYFARYNILIPYAQSGQAYEFYCHYGNPDAYNASVEAWQDQTGKILQYNGNVKLVRTFGDGAPINQYNLGDECTALTGGWTNGYSSGTSPTRTKQPDHLYAQSINGRALFTTVNAIDLTNVSEISVDWAFADLAGNAGNYNALMGVGAVQADNVFTKSVALSRSVHNDTDRHVMTLDVSSLTGSYYIKCGTSSGYTDTTAKVRVYNINLKSKDVHYALFDGSGDYFALANSTDTNLLSNNFCIECFAMSTSFATKKEIYSKSLSSSWGQLRISWETSGKISVVGSTNGSAWQLDILGATALSTNVMYHIAVARNGNTFTLYINGVIDGTGTLSGSLYSTTEPTFIGYLNGSSTFGFIGYMGGFRITNGRTRYPSAFTPPSSFEIDGPDVVFCTNFDTIYDQNYAMVQHMGDSLVDATGNGNNGTATGTTVVDTEYGKARSFNGTSNFVAFPNGFLTSIQAHTVLTLAKVVASSAYRMLFTKDSNSLMNSANPYTSLRITNSNQLAFQLGGGGKEQQALTATHDNDSYNAICGKFDGAATKIFTHGILRQTGTGDGVPSGTISNVPRIGRATAGDYYNSEICETRISSVARSDAWIKAESLALKNTLLTIEDA